MKLGTIEKVYALILLVIFGLVVMHAPLTVYIGTRLPDFSQVIKTWEEFLMLIAAPFAVILITRRQLWRQLLRDRTIQLAGAYAVLHVLVGAAVLNGPLATLAGLAIDLRYIVFFVLVFICILSSPQYRRLFLKVALGGAIVVIGFAVLQLFLPKDILTHIGYGDETIQPYLTVDRNPQFIRINSTLRGPNPLGAYAVIVLSLLAAAVARRKISIRKNRSVFAYGALAIGSVIALWFSYSRSALGAAVLAVGAVTAIVARRHMSRRAWITAAVIVCALTGGLIAGRDSSLFSNVLLHENLKGGSAVSSNDGHVQSLVSGFHRLANQPIGAGIGSTGSASLLTDSPLIIENQYLFIAHEVGWLGLGLFMSLFTVILRRLWQRRYNWLGLGVFASGLGLAFIGLVLPVWVDDTVSLVWWGLAAVGIASEGNHDR